MSKRVLLFLSGMALQTVLLWATPDAQPAAHTAVETNTLIFLLFILIISIFLGFEVISKVPSLLHTPLMSGSNAISGITILGALIAAGQNHDALSAFLGGLAVAFAMINVAGGYLVTDRMLQMFKKKAAGK